MLVDNSIVVLENVFRHREEEGRGPVESASSVATVDATVRRTDFIDEGRTGGTSVTAADLDLLDTLRAEVAVGRWLDEASASLPTVVLGHTAARRLGIKTSALYYKLEKYGIS